MNQKTTNDTIAEAIRDPNFSFIDTFADASEPEKIRKELTRLLFLHRETRKQLELRERERVVLNHKYEKLKRKAYKENENAKNEKIRATLVEISTEEEKYNLEIQDQKIKELNRRLNSIKLELDVYKTIGFSIKTEMGL